MRNNCTNKPLKKVVISLERRMDDFRNYRNRGEEQAEIKDGEMGKATLSE